MEPYTQNDLFVSVIIPVLNDAERLRKCLIALDLQTYPKENYEVLVIDNGSKDNIEEVINSFGQSRLLFEDYPSQAAARNKGILAAKGSILALTDSDCIPALDWIEKGAEKFLGVSNCDYVGGKISIFVRNVEKPTACELYELVFAFPQKMYIEKNNYSTTANLFTRKSVFDKMGLFKPSSYTGSDEEWGGEVFTQGFQQIYAEDVEILHPARSSWKELSLKQSRIRLSRYRKSLQKKPLSTNWQRFRWIFKSPLIPTFYQQISIIRRSKKLKGVKQRVSVMYISLLRLCFDFWIRFSIIYGIHIKYDYELLRENSGQFFTNKNTKKR